MDAGEVDEGRAADNVHVGEEVGRVQARDAGGRTLTL